MSTLLGSMIVTLTSSAEKIEAYSTPMTLAPTTISWRGMRVRPRISSESTMFWPSKAMWAGR